MARKSFKKKSARRDSRSSWNDIPGLLMLGIGTLLLLALISYVPEDLPSSSFFAPFSRTATPNDPAQNFIGRIGAITAGWFYFTLGAGSYLIVAALLFIGLSKMIFPYLRLRPKLGWAAGFVLSGSCLIEWQTWFLRDWHERFNLAGGAGGWIGTSLARGLTSILGSVGTPLMLLGIYFSCLILMTGLHPMTQLLNVCDLLRQGIRLWQQRREEIRLARISERERLELEHQRIAKEQRRIEKQLRKQGAPVPAYAEAASTSAPVAEQDNEFADLPPPKITDNSAPPPSPVKKKPSLAEVLNRGRASQSTAGESIASYGTQGDMRFVNYELPESDLLDTRETQDHQSLNTRELELIQSKIIDTLDQFGIKVSPGDITKGPTITRYEVYPAKGVRVDRILILEKDIARATRAERINILAPIPGKDTVGIEIANAKKVKVTLRELLEGPAWQETKAKIPIALGKDVYGNTIIADLAAMPHCLIAGATGSGKSVCINSIIASLLYRFSPEQLRLVMVDPKVVELQMYNSLPHLVVPVVTDPKKVLLALRWVIDEMMKRYELFAKTGVRNFTGYNARPKPKSQRELDEEAEAKGPLEGATAALQKLSVIIGDDSTDGEAEDISASSTESETIGPASSTQVLAAQTTTPIRVPRDSEITYLPDQLPYIVVVIDELADLMQTAPADVEGAIARITQMARAAGIHLIVATQTPRADVITGVIKANVPSRIAFQVSSALDSRVILDENGAERLLGQGDMLYRPPGTSRLIRAQGVFITDEEVHRLVTFCSTQAEPNFENAIHEQLQSNALPEEEVSPEDEELVQKCIEVMRQEKKASTSMLQRRLRLGYTRAARIVDILERRGVVGPENGARGREILVDLDQDWN